MDEICVRLPLPISVNHAYAGNGKRYRSKEYLAWLDHAHIIMNRFGTFEITGDQWLRVEYEYELPLFTSAGKKKVQDLGNLEKVLSDFLVKRIKGFEDHKIKEMKLSKKDSTINYVTVKIYEIPQENSA